MDRIVLSEENAKKNKIKDKLIGLNNRFYISEGESLRAMKYFMDKYGIDEIDALNKLFSLAFEKKAKITINHSLYQRRGIKEGTIRNLEEL